MAIQRGTTWQANVRLLSGDRLRPGGFASELAAEAWEAQARANDALGLKPPPIDTGRRSLSAKLETGATIGELRKRVLFTPFREGWKGSKDESGADERSLQIVQFYTPEKPIVRIDINEVDRLVNNCVEMGNSAATINRKIAALSKMLNFAERRGLLTSVPHMPRQEEYEGRIRYLTRTEEARILAALEEMGQHDTRQLAIFLIDSGARISEALAMTHADWGTVATFWETKGGKARSVPLTGRAKAACSTGAHRPEGPFCHLNYWTVRAHVEKARERVNLGDDVVIHVFRHTCASRLVQGGWDIRRVQTWMGHKSITTTLRYAHLAPGALDDMVATLEQTGNVVQLRRTA